MNHPKRVLIDDDEPNVRLVFKTVLELAGYTTLVAETGEDALRQLAEGPVDLILLDLRMPGLDGMEVLRALRDLGSNIPTVIITAHGSVPDAVAAMKLGAIDFVSKPLTPEVLRRQVAEVLGRQVDHPTPSTPAATVPVTVKARFADNLRQAKKALNARRFDEADVFLRQAIALEPGSAEAHNLQGVLHEVCHQYDASYASYKAALKADADYEPARQNMLRYYEQVTFGRSKVPIDTGDP